MAAMHLHDMADLVGSIKGEEATFRVMFGRHCWPRSAAPKGSQSGRWKEKRRE